MQLDGALKGTKRSLFNLYNGVYSVFNFFNRDMDPQQRLFFEVASEALEDSGHLPPADGTNRIGLCVGAAHNTWGPSKQPILAIPL